MAPNIIISYDGTPTDDDALALGKVFADAGASPSLAYVRHTPESERGRENAVQREAEELLERGASKLGRPDVARHVVLDASTPEGLRVLADREGAEVVIFGSEYRTAAGHVAPGTSAARLLADGSTAVALATAGLSQLEEPRIATIAATGSDGDDSAEQTARSLAQRIGATVVPLTHEHADLIIVGSRPEAAEGQVSVSAASEYLIEISTCPVLVVPRGVAVKFGAAVEAAATA